MGFIQNQLKCNRYLHDTHKQWVSLQTMASNGFLWHGLVKGFSCQGWRLRSRPSRENPLMIFHWVSLRWPQLLKQIPHLSFCVNSWIKFWCFMVSQIFNFLLYNYDCIWDGVKYLVQGSCHLCFVNNGRWVFKCL